MSIQQISLKLNIPKPTLRFWEKKFEGFLVPLRTRGGQRRYTVRHISIIKEIKKFKRKGMSLAEIKKKFVNYRKVRDDRADSHRMDILAGRIADLVRAEVYSFFHEEEVKKKSLEVIEP